MALNFNTFPYSDDFDPNKNFNRILFKPGVAVQARELTQSQTILQNQISEFASTIFSKNTPVSGGNVTTNLTCSYIKLNPLDINNAPLIAENFLNRIITDNTGTILARVIATAESVAGLTTKAVSDPHTLILSYISGKQFTDNMQLTATDGSGYTATTIGVSKGKISTGLSSVASISPGVYYIINGYNMSSIPNGDGSFSKYSIGNFVNVTGQTIILDKYDSFPSIRVGLEINEFIEDYIGDPSLLDPAIGASNFQAPGADRYGINLTLVSYPLTFNNDSSFIELVTIKSGKIVSQTDTTVYSTIDDYFSKRDYETNGDYIVNPFTFTPGSNVSGNTALYDLNISKGIAYVHGYRLENQSNIVLTSDRARSTSNVSGKVVNTNYGNFCYVDNISGFFDVTKQPHVDLHCVPAANINTTQGSVGYNATLVGTSHIRNLIYRSDNDSTNTSAYIYQAYLTSVSTRNITGKVSTASSNTIINITDTANALSAANGAYNNMTLTISSGLDSNSGDSRKVVGYVVNGSTKTITVSSPFTVTPDNTSRFILNTKSSDVESIVQKTVNGAAYTLTANSNINFSISPIVLQNVGNSEMLFNLGTDTPYVSKVSSSSYTSTKNWRNVQFSSGGVLTLNITSGPLSFAGSTLSDNNIKQYYTIVDVATNEILNITTSVCTVTLTQNNTILTITNPGYANYIVNVITAVNVKNADGGIVLKAKNLVLGNTTILSTSTTSIVGATTVVANYNVGQITIPNSIAISKNISLYTSDVKRIVKIFDSGSPSTPVSSVFGVTQHDVTSSYLLNKGQTDSYYGHSSISLIPGASSATGNLLIIFDSYKHTLGDGYFSVLSYMPTASGGISSSPEAYQNIPTYIAGDGIVYRLSDCLDFRPTLAQGTTSGEFEYPGSSGGLLLPTDGTNYNCSYDYYLGRKDLLVLSKDRSFQIVKGVSSINSTYPIAPTGTLILANLALDPYTAYVPGENPSGTIANLAINTIPHNRWAKSDITDLQSRVNNLEYYTSLSILEQNAQSLQISDTSGLNRFKNGILVDDFSSYSTADTKNLDFSANINILNKRLSPITLVDNFQLQNPVVLAGLGTIKSTNTFAVDSINGTSSNIFTLPYIKSDCIVQKLASTSISINPFSVVIYQGTASLFPPMDNWVDTYQNPAILTSSPALQITQQTGGVNAINAGSFQLIPGSLYTTETITNVDPGHIGGGTGQAVDAHTTSTYGSYLKNITTSVSSLSNINVNNGYVSNISILPYIRAQQIGFNVQGLKANAPISSWFDGVNIDNYIISPDTLELVNVSGKFAVGDIIGFVTLNKFRPTARVEGVFVYPGTANNRLYVSNVVGAPAYTTTTKIRNATYNTDGSIISYGTTTPIVGATGIVKDGVHSIHQSGHATSVGGTQGTTGNFKLSGTPTSYQIYSVSDPYDWSSFMNQYAVWGTLNDSSTTYNQTFPVNFPYAGLYSVSCSWVGTGSLTLDSTTIIPPSTGIYATSPTPTSLTVSSAGNHNIIVNISNTTGITCGVALLITDVSGNLIFSSAHPITAGAILFSGVQNESVMPNGGAWFTGVSSMAISGHASDIPDFYTGAKINITSKYVYSYTSQTATYIPPTPQYGDGGSIICTKLFELGLLDPKIYEADEKFGKLVQQNDPKVYEGYIRWASIVVDWMNGNGPDIMFWIKDDVTRKSVQKEMVTKWTHKIATPWAEHMAYRMGVIEKDNRLGKFIMAIGFPISRIANLLINNKKPGVVIGYSMWGLFSVLYSISKIFQKDIK